MNIAKNTLNHVIYPRNTQAYSDARTSSSTNRKEYKTFIYMYYPSLKIAKKKGLSYDTNQRAVGVSVAWFRTLLAVNGGKNTAEWRVDRDNIFVYTSIQTRAIF